MFSGVVGRVQKDSGLWGVSDVGGSEFLVGEEGLGLLADGVGAQRAAEGQLPGTRLVGLQVGLDQIRQRLDGTEDRL